MSSLLDEPDNSALSDVEKVIRERFDKKKADRQRVPSTAIAAAPSDRVVQLGLPDEMRGRMPLTKDKYVVKENPHLVQWEREVRKFLRNLSPVHGHRVAAVHIYEWATGLQLVEIVAEEKAARERGEKRHTTYRADLRHINQALRFYFDKPYSTYIAGRKVPNAYRVRPGYLITRHRPMTLTLYVEYCEKTLYP